MIELRTQTLVEDYDYISRSDAAVDVERDDFENAWRLYEDGKGPAPIKAGATPTIFKLRHLRGRDYKKISPYLMRAARNPEFSIQASWAIAAVVLRKVENLRTPDGKLFEVMLERDDDGEMIASAKTLELLGLATVTELSSVAMARSGGLPL